ncbi:MAG: hypothetical protein SGJ13_15000 [Actinomycetota bacterium]|nr:hypothetical protein [Actinomycetota bacterium]
MYRTAAAIVFVATIVAGCGGDDDAGTSAATDAPATSTTPVAPALTTRVTEPCALVDAARLEQYGVDPASATPVGDEPKVPGEVAWNGCVWSGGTAIDVGFGAALLFQQLAGAETAAGALQHNQYPVFAPTAAVEGLGDPATSAAGAPIPGAVRSATDFTRSGFVAARVGDTLVVWMTGAGRNVGDWIAPDLAARTELVQSVIDAAPELVPDPAPVVAAEYGYGRFDRLPSVASLAVDGVATDGATGQCTTGTGEEPKFSAQWVDADAATWYLTSGFGPASLVYEDSAGTSMSYAAADGIANGPVLTKADIDATFAGDGGGEVVVQGTITCGPPTP